MSNRQESSATNNSSITKTKATAGGSIAIAVVMGIIIQEVTDASWLVLVSLAAACALVAWLIGRTEKGR